MEHWVRGKGPHKREREVEADYAREGLQVMIRRLEFIPSVKLLRFEPGGWHDLN